MPKPVEPPLQLGFISGRRVDAGAGGVVGVPTPGWVTCTVIWSPALKVTVLEPIVDVTGRRAGLADTDDGLIRDRDRRGVGRRCLRHPRRQDRCEAYGEEGGGTSADQPPQPAGR